MIRRLLLGAVALVAVLVAIIVGTGGDDAYELRVPLENASGLKSGSAVVISGVTHGKVELELGDDDRIIAKLLLDREVAPIGRDARVAVTAANFLGQKRVELSKGDTSRPAPDGFVVPASQVTTPTDLDQVLSVLDADTRTRATILLNELGVAAAGRRFDIGELVRQFPRGFVDATAVLHQVKSDNHSLRDLLQHSDGFVAEATARRRDLVRMIDVLGQSAKSASAKRAQLRVTLARAPGTLRTLQGFLADVESTTKPLAPAADAIADAAPPLADTLGEVEPFTAAARPTLGEVSAVAPKLTVLGDNATPVLRRSLPMASSLATLGGDLTPVSRTLDNSADNIIAVLENWSRAIQFRDGLGHVFRGEAGYSTDLITSMIDRLVRPVDRKRGAKGKRRGPQAPKPSAPTPVTPQLTTPKLPDPVKKTLDALPEVGKAVDGVLGGTQQQLPDGHLLDFLLGP